MQPSKLVAVAALLLAAVATASAQAGGNPPDICTNKNEVMWTPDHANCAFTCPDTSKWTMDCRFANMGVECKVASADSGPGDVTFTCSLPPSATNPIDATCAGTFAGVSRNNNACLMESIATVFFSWQEGPGAAPAAEGP